MGKFVVLGHGNSSQLVECCEHWFFAVLPSMGVSLRGYVLTKLAGFCPSFLLNIGFTYDR
ncbi:MAG: hypothetical protein ACJA1I_001398 [Zhongshania marina]|jgi:hypothetical protein